jgi:hypothetical protein
MANNGLGHRLSEALPVDGKRLTGWDAGCIGRRHDD